MRLGHQGVFLPRLGHHPAVLLVGRTFQFGGRHSLRMDDDWPTFTCAAAGKAAVAARAGTGEHESAPGRPDMPRARCGRSG